MWKNGSARWKKFQNFSKIFKNFQNFSKNFKNFKNEKSEKTRKSCLQKMKKVCCNFSLFLKNMFCPTFSCLSGPPTSCNFFILQGQEKGAPAKLSWMNRSRKFMNSHDQNTFAQRTFATFKNTFSCCEHANHVIDTPERDPFFQLFSDRSTTFHIVGINSIILIRGRLPCKNSKKQGIFKCFRMFFKTNGTGVFSVFAKTEN